MFSLENLCASGCAVFLEDFRGEEFEIRPKISEEARVGFVLWTILVHSKINGKNCCSLVGCVSRCSLVFQSIGTRFWCLHWRTCAHLRMHTIWLSIVFVFCAGKKKYCNQQWVLKHARCSNWQVRIPTKHYPLETENFLLLLCRLTRWRLKLGNK